MGPRKRGRKTRRKATVSACFNVWVVRVCSSRRSDTRECSTERQVVGGPPSRTLETRCFRKHLCVTQPVSSPMHIATIDPWGQLARTWITSKIQSMISTTHKRAGPGRRDCGNRTHRNRSRRCHPRCSCPSGSPQVPASRPGCKGPRVE